MYIPFDNNVYHEENEIKTVISCELKTKISDFCKNNNVEVTEFLIGAFAAFLARYNYGYCCFKLKNRVNSNEEIIFNEDKNLIKGKFDAFIDNIESYCKPFYTEAGVYDVLLVMSNKNDNKYEPENEYSIICLNMILDNDDVMFHIKAKQNNIRIKDLIAELTNYLEYLVLCNNITNDRSINILVSSSLEKYYINNAIEKLFTCFNYSAHMIDDVVDVIDGIETIHIILYSLWDVADSSKSTSENCKVFELYNEHLLKNINNKTFAVILHGLKNIEYSEELNSKIEQYGAEFVNKSKSFCSSVLDFSSYSKSDIYNQTLYQIANISYKKDFFNVIAREIVWSYFNSINKRYKLIVIDGDETLWDGIISDDGLQNIKVGHQKRSFQKKLKELKEKGILLAICSKNDIADIEALFETNTQMILKKEDFVSIIANFESKPNNVKRLCETYNVDMNSVVFIDDSMFECGEMMRKLPKVTVLPFFAGYDLGSIIQELTPVHNMIKTKEDALRTNTSRNLTDNIHLEDKEAFWKELNAQYLFSFPEEEDIPRIVQLNSRVNRFRLSIDELDYETVTCRVQKKQSFVIRVNDVFGDYGIVSYISWSVEGEQAIIDNWIMSCRLSVEYAEHIIWNYLLDYFKENEIKNIKVRVEDTGKNVRFKSFCNTMNFKIEDGYFICENTNYSTLYKNVCVDCKTERYRNEKESNIVSTKVKEKFSVADYGVSQKLFSVSKSYNSKNAWLFLNNQQLLGASVSDSEIDLAELKLLDDDKEKIIKLWEGVLRCKITDCSKSFIAYGGNSMTYMELISLMIELWNIDVLQMPFRLDNSILNHEELIKKYKNSKAMVITKVEKTEFVVPTFSERFFTYKNSSFALHIPVVINLDINIGKSGIEEKLTRLLNKYRLFKSNYRYADGNIMVSIENEIQVEVFEHNINADTPNNSYLDSIMKEFNFQKAPLVHFHLINSNDNKYLMIDYCHVIVDGLSADRMTDIIYDALRDCVDYEFDSNNDDVYDYYDYCYMYEEKIARSNYLCDKEYWLNELEGIESNFDLPIPYRICDDTKPVRININKDIMEDIESVCNARNITEFSFFLSTYAAFLHSILCRKDITVGIPVNCKYSVDSQEDIGQYVNTMVFRSVLTDDKNTGLHDFFGKCNEKFIENMSHSKIMLQEVAEIVDDAYNHKKLFDTIFVLETEKKLKAKKFDYYQNSYKSLMDVNLIRRKNNATIQVNYNPSKLSYPYIKKITEYFYEYICSITNLMKKATNNTKLPNCWTVNENIKYGNKEFVSDRTIIDHFIDTSKNNLDKICLIINSKKYTYNDVNNATNAFANQIVSQIGVSQKNILVICYSPELIAFSVLSIMKSGNVYIPVSPLSPEERIQEIIEKCNVVAYIAEEKRANIEQEYIRFEPNFDEVKNDVNNTNIDSNAYIIYTSGTTGKSKGVLIKHKGLINTIIARNAILGIEKNDNSILLMGAASDGFFTSFFSPLIAGAELCIPKSIFDINNIMEIIKSENIKTFLCTPTMYNSILNLSENSLLNKIRMVALAGEGISENLVEKSENMYPYLVLANEYGPTENSICTSINQNITKGSTISAGRLIHNVNAVVMNKNDKVCHDYIIGELHLSGVGLSLGYIGDNNNDSKFYISKGENWYKTGDLAYWDEDDNLYIVGRDDSQVKVNGYRVDLLEIQNAMSNYKNIDECAVLYENNTNLVGYYVSKYQLDKNDIIRYLSNKLNRYMVPLQYKRVSKIPLTEIGKTNSRELKKYLIAEDDNNIINNETNVDLKVVDTIKNIFSELLRENNINMNTDFFEIGGNSLECVLMLEKLREKFKTDLEIEDVRLNPTPYMLASQITSEKSLEVNTTKLHPFNKFWFIDCYCTSLLAIFQMNNRPVSHFIRSLSIEDVKKDGEYKYVYKFEKPLSSIMGELALEYHSGIFDDDFSYQVTQLLGKGYPVIVHVDCFHLPYCKDYFHKKHCDHVVTIIDYNENYNSFEVLDQRNMQSVSFCSYIISQNDLQKSTYAAISTRDSFNNVDYVSLIPNGVYDEEMYKSLANTQFEEVIKKTIEYVEDNPDDVNIVVERLLNYIMVEKEVFMHEKNDTYLNELKRWEAGLKRLLMRFINPKHKADNSKLLLNLLGGQL